MNPDYIILAVIVVLAVGGGAFLLYQVRNYRLVIATATINNQTDRNLMVF